MNVLTRIAMWQAAWLAFLPAALPMTALADDLKVSQLEQDVRELKRQVDQQGRRIDSLERDLAQSRASLAPNGDRSRRASVENASGEWLTMANWNKVKVGMSELDVIQALGPPTSLRKTKEGEQTLLYALEIGTGSFLTGAVKLNERRVVEVQKPTFK